MYTYIRNVFLLGFIGIAVSACSTLSKSECLTANWETIGYGDGTKGYKASRISQHRSACADYGVAPDLNAYSRGRDRGLNQYCVPSTGYRKGLSGYTYNGVCRGKNERAFVDALNYGLVIYKANRRLSSLKAKYDNQLRYIKKLEDELHFKEEEIVSGRLSKVKALMLLNETKEMAEELGKAKRDLNNLQDAIDDQAHEVSELKQQGNYR